VAILDGADRLTEEAANALLKALEEPPERTRFLLLTSQPAQCLATITSRCQTIRFQRIAASSIEEALVSRRRCEPAVARIASHLAQGSFSRAIELTTEWTAYQTLTNQFAEGTSSRWLEWAIPNDRQELSLWLAGSILWLRDVSVASVAQERLVNHVASLASIRRQAQGFDRERCVEAAMRLIELWESLEQFVNPRLVGTLLREEWLALLERAGH
jgi:hypothetical protein